MIVKHKNSDSNDLDSLIYDKSVDKALKTLTILELFDIWVYNNINIFLKIHNWLNIINNTI